MEKDVGSRRWVPVLLVGLPLWMVVSGAAGIWWNLRSNRRAEAEREHAYARGVNAADLAEDVRKVAFVVGERGTGGQAAQRGLDRVAALIEGSLGRSNTGYEVRRLAVSGGSDWPLIEVSNPGDGSGAAGVWVLCGYDAPPGERGVEHNASGVAAVMAAARELVDERFRRPVHFLFLPHVFDPGAPVMETAAAALRRIESAGGARQVLCVEAMGRAAGLVVATRDTGSPVVERIVGLGEVAGAEALCLVDDFDLASVLFESGVAAARVTSVGGPPAGGSESLPDPGLLAGSSGRLVELLRRLAVD